MKPIAIIRILASLPLIGIGVMHLVGVAPLLPIVEGAGFPFPELSARLAPIAQILAGLLLLTGIQARVGALLALGTMAGALLAHLRFDWADEPPMLLPILVIAGAVTILLRGPGSLRAGDPHAPAPSPRT
jgi:uncharacterized membrane protein YphA (DoxX/SURF4 family)